MDGRRSTILPNGARQAHGTSADPVQVTHTLQQHPSPETHRMHGAGNLARCTTHVDGTVDETAHWEEPLHSLPYLQGKDWDPTEPWAHSPVYGTNGEWA
ncbi:Hypothetical predicted protein [Pelobates cultripes]|uniref:Uncharacterized protein n=1 Tax=Pelobates cultripes TaxID=61616 RepID=A0AAD1WNB8_PELCU|nr:Hypothetical predicted protein [Pelobates cultripes]